MIITFHGAFERYTPDLPSDDPRVLAKVLFSKNENGDDFYDIRDSIPADALTIVVKPDTRVVWQASFDNSGCFSYGGDLFYSIEGATITDYKDVLSKVFDAEAGTFSVPPPPPPDPRDVRLAALEAKVAALMGETQ